MARAALVLLTLLGCTADVGRGDRDPAPDAGSPATPPDLPHGPKAGVTCPPGATAVAPGERIQAAVDAAGPGATICLRRGTHRLEPIAPQSGQRFVGESGAILSGARVLTDFARVGAAWVASGQTQEGTPLEDPDGICREGRRRCVHPEDLFLDDVPLLHVTSVDEGGPGRWFFDYAADQVYLWDDPSGRVVEASVLDHAFTGWATDVTIDNLTVEKYATVGQSAAVELGTGWILERSEARWNHFGGVGTGECSIVRHSRLHDNGCFGLHGAGADILVEENEVDHNGYAGFDPYWGSGGSKWVYTTNLVVRRNFSHHNLGPGFWTDINNVDTLYEENVVEDNERAGIFHEISYAAVIRSNTARRNGLLGKDFPGWTTNAGIEVTSSPNVEIVGNVLIDNWQGITALDDHRGSGTAGPWTVTNLYVHDNMVTTTITDAGGGRTGVIDTVGTAAFSAEAGNRFVDNHYVLGANAQYFIWMGADLTEAQWVGFGQDTTGTFDH